jgi:hypothetical protein
MMLMAATVSFIQTIIEESKRGRIMSCYVMIFTGAAPVGSYLTGALSTKMGTPYALFLGGLLCVIGAFAFIARMENCYEIMDSHCSVSKESAALSRR